MSLLVVASSYSFMSCSAVAMTPTIQFSRHENSVRWKRTLASRTEYKDRLVDRMLLQDGVEAIVKDAREHEVVLILFALNAVYVPSELARAKFLSKLVRMM